MYRLSLLFMPLTYTLGISNKQPHNKYVVIVHVKTNYLLTKAIRTPVNSEP